MTIQIEDLCEHDPDYRVTAGDLDNPLAGHASTYSCSHPECLDLAKEWVKQQTGLPGQSFVLKKHHSRRRTV